MVKLNKPKHRHLHPKIPFYTVTAVVLIAVTVVAMFAIGLRRPEPISVPRSAAVGGSEQEPLCDIIAQVVIRPEIGLSLRRDFRSLCEIEEQLELLEQLAEEHGGSDRISVSGEFGEFGDFGENTFTGEVLISDNGGARIAQVEIAWRDEEGEKIFYLITNILEEYASV
jgi:hypothetical protein